MGIVKYSDRTRVTTEAIEQIVGVIVEHANPRRIVLFGSAAREDVSEPADVDLMIVVGDEIDRRATARHLYRALFDAGVSVPVDLVVATEAVFAKHSDTAGLVYRDIARDGRELYVAA